MNNNKSSFKKVAEVVAIINMVALVGGCVANPYYNYPYMPVVPRYVVNRGFDPWAQYQYTLPPISDADFDYYYSQPRKTLANPYQQKQQVDANAEVRQRLEAQRRERARQEREELFRSSQLHREEQRRQEEKRFDYYNNLKARGGRAYW